MRISIDDSDPGNALFKRVVAASAISVFLDGVRVTECYTADTARGYVICAATDGRGHIIVVDGEVQHKTRRGRVELAFEPRQGKRCA
jgi:hypothetical protein